MAVTTLTCSGKYKQYKLTCHQLAVWAVKGADGYWHGACHQHPHQVLKRLGADGAELTVQLATKAMAENERLRNLPAIVTEAERLTDALRRLVLDGDPRNGEPWTAHRAMLLLRSGRHRCTPELAQEVLELLCEEHVMAHQGKGVYECVAHVPQ